jgi:hypothetical protein
MGLGVGGGKDACQHVVSFLVGAALPTALLILLASDRLGEGLSTISSSWGATAPTQLPPAPAAGDPPPQGDTNTTLSTGGGGVSGAAPNNATHGQQVLRPSDFIIELV